MAPTNVTPQKNVWVREALSAPPERSTEATKALQTKHPEVRIAPKQPEVSLESPPLVSQPPAKKKECLQRSLDGSPITPPPATPVAPPFPPTAHVIRPPDIRIFDQIAAARPLSFGKEVERKIDQRSEELKNSEIQAGAIAQIKKYLYQEEYDLCTRDLAKIRDLFPQNPEIQAFVENTSKRLVELQRIKKFEVQARDLMTAAGAFYQEGKREEALVAVREILRVNPNHVQAREFVSFVERHQGKYRKKQPSIQKVRAGRAAAKSTLSASSATTAASGFSKAKGSRGKEKAL